MKRVVVDTSIYNRQPFGGITTLTRLLVEYFKNLEYNQHNQDDVVVLYPYYKWFLSFKNRTVLIVHDFLDEEFYCGLRGMLRVYKKVFSIWQADKVVFISNATKESGLKRYPLLFKKKIYTVIHNGVPVCTPSINSTHLGSLPLEYAVFIGRVNSRNKNFSLAHSWSMSSSISLVVLGAHDRKFNVRGCIYLDNLNINDVHAIIKSATCLFHSSLNEGFGITIVESQILETPVFCLKTPINEEIAGKGAFYVNKNEKLDIRTYRDDQIKEIVRLGKENTKRFQLRNTLYNYERFCQ